MLTAAGSRWNEKNKMNVAPPSGDSDEEEDDDDGGGGDIGGAAARALAHSIGCDAAEAACARRWAAFTKARKRLYREWGGGGVVARRSRALHRPNRNHNRRHGMVIRLFAAG